jgi:hypothetical protein
MRLWSLFLQNLEWRLIEFARDYPRSNVFWFITEIRKWETSK